MSSIAEQLAELINPTPTVDPEDDLNEDTRAKLIDKDLLDDDNDAPSHSGKKTIGGLRKSLPLEEADTKYKGKVVSRKDLNSESDDSFDDNFQDESDNDLDIEDESMGYSDENDPTNEDDDEEVDSDEGESSNEDDDYAPGLFKESKSEVTEKEKGKDTMNQLTLWECILEARIKLQKLISLANQAPRPESYEDFLEQGGSDVATSIKTATSSLSKLGAELFKLQENLLDQTEEKSEKESDSQSKTLKIGEYFLNEDWNETIEKRCSRLRKRRNRILQHWYDKTLLATSKVNKSFKSFERPTVAQIDHILANRDRLIRRTRVQRTSYRVLGTEQKQPEASEDENAHLKEVDEIFDDDDFYQQLLRQFIERKTSQPGSSDTMQDSIEMTRKWLKLQQFKTKTKRDFDHKTRKGKKIRYVVHPKLVSFMAPSDRSTWSHESRNQLVKSIFGKSLLISDQT